MATLLNTKQKLCLVKTNGPLRDLGGITGPILYPCRIDMRKVINMVQNGVKVYEVNPKNYSETVLLTIQNVQKNNFPEPDKYVMPETPKKVEPPVAKKTDVIPAVQDNIGEAPKEETDLEKAVSVAASDNLQNTEDVKEEIASEAETITPVQTYKNSKGGKNDFNKKR